MILLCWILYSVCYRAEGGERFGMSFGIDDIAGRVGVLFSSNRFWNTFS